MKGVDGDTFQMLVARNPQTVADVVQLCQSYDELRKHRVSTRRATEDTAEVSAFVNDVAADHTVLLPHIKQFIREEVAHQLSLVTRATESVTSLDPRLRQVIETQVAQTLPPSPPTTTPLTYAAVISRPPAPTVSGTYRDTESFYTTTPPTRMIPHPTSPTGPSAVSSWRTFDNLPVCFACGFVRHIARYCRRRNLQSQDGGNRPFSSTRAPPTGAQVVMGNVCTPQQSPRRARGPRAAAFRLRRARTS